MALMGAGFTRSDLGPRACLVRTSPAEPAPQLNLSFLPHPET